MEEKDKCTICNKTFVKTQQLMIHKKSKHLELTPYCTKDRNGKCTFSQCWFRHISDHIPDNHSKANHEKPSEPRTFEPVNFPKHQEPIKPPEPVVKDVNVEELQKMMKTT